MLTRSEQFISNLKKENFDLKLNLYHHRERGTKTENELSKLRTQLRRANARTEELTQANDQLNQELQEREHALTKAVEVIALYEDHFADHEAMCNGQLSKKPELNEQGATPDQATGPNSGSFRSPYLKSFGISPFSLRNSPPGLSTPYRAQFYRSGNIAGSPCPSANSNLIDLNTPCSATPGEAGLVRGAFIPGSGRKPIRLSLPPREFINRCTSVTSESPLEGEGPPSPTHSGVSALDSPQLSMLSETSFASMYRGQNDGSELFSDSHNLEPSSCDEQTQFVDAPVSLKKRWGQIQVQKIQVVGAFTPSRRVSPTRRMSPRVEIMEFKDKQDKQRGRASRGPDVERSVMPPTPDSISPRGAVGFNSSEDGDNNDDANCCMSMVSPTEIDNPKKRTSVDEDVCGPTLRDALETSSLVRHNETTTPRSNPQKTFKLQSGQTTTAAQKEQAFGDITNMHDTQSRLGYGFGDRLGNRNYSVGFRKQVGRDPTHGTRKYIGGRNASRKESSVIIPVRMAVTRELQMGTPAMPAPVVDYNLSTPPYTPNSEESTGITAARHLVRKGSWESLNSGSNSNSDRVVSRQKQLIALHTAGPINPHTLKRRNSTATATATKLSVTLNKGLNEPVFNIRRPSGIPSPEVKKQSEIPTLVRSSSQKVGAKERRWQ